MVHVEIFWTFLIDEIKILWEGVNVSSARDCLIVRRKMAICVASIDAPVPLT